MDNPPRSLSFEKCCFTLPMGHSRSYQDSRSCRSSLNKNVPLQQACSRLLGFHFLKGKRTQHWWYDLESLELLFSLKSLCPLTSLSKDLSLNDFRFPLFRSVGNERFTRRNSCLYPSNWNPKSKTEIHWAMLETEGIALAWQTLDLKEMKVH